jgi:rare lipoprotein A
LIVATTASALVLLAPPARSQVKTENGIASIYSTRDGTATASGIRLNDNDLTAAYRTFAFHTRVRVTNKRNGKSVVVKITDRGPFVRGRIIDLTPAGGKALGFSGLTVVELHVIDRPCPASVKTDAIPRCPAG